MPDQINFTGNPRDRQGRRCNLARLGAMVARTPVIAAASLLMVSGGVLAQQDVESTPHEVPFEARAVEQVERATVAEPAEAESAAAAAPIAATSTLVTPGLNFQASEHSDDSSFIPPDTMGAAGPNHIVEMINGNYEVFDKIVGDSVDSLTLDEFWTNEVGLTIPANQCVAGMCAISRGPTACVTVADCRTNFTFDPRIVFDPDSGRWFAVSIDFGDGNNLYIARSDTDDPTGDWDGAQIAADTVGAAEFHDYPTLAVDADGLYICTQDFSGGGNESCYSIPKADLLLPVPSIANLTRFEATPAGLPVVEGSIQPALDFGSSDGRAALLGSTGVALVRSDILGAGAGGATLGVITAIGGDPGHAAPPDARQPHPFDPGVTIENVAPRFVGNVFEHDDSLWAAHAVQGSGTNSAIQ